MRDLLKSLLAITEGCREDMHEPDEQELNAEFGPSFRYSLAGMEKVSFDNACYPNPAFPHPRSIEMEKMDMGFWLIRKNGKKETRTWFNLADVIALARKAQV